MSDPLVDAPARLREKAARIRAYPYKHTDAAAALERHAFVLDLLADSYEALVEIHQIHDEYVELDKIPLLSRIEEAAR